MTVKGPEDWIEQNLCCEHEFHEKIVILSRVEKDISFCAPTLVQACNGLILVHHRKKPDLHFSSENVLFGGPDSLHHSLFSRPFPLIKVLFNRLSRRRFSWRFFDRQINNRLLS